MSHIHRSTITQPIVQEALEAALRGTEGVDQEGQNLSIDQGISDDDYEVSDMRDVLLAPVNMAERRKLR